MGYPPKSARLTITARGPSAIPLEVEGVTPERVGPLSVAEVAKLPVFHGNRREELGQFFAVEGDPAGGWIDFNGDTGHVKFIGAGMTSGTVSVETDAGMHAGARMTGGTLVIDGRAGDWLGAEMRGGKIFVNGPSGNLVGAAYRGSRRGMTGGTILARSAVGDEVGLLMRRGLILVGGPCGEFAGASMIAGTLVLLGRAGGRLGAGMKRGTIVAAGPVAELPPSFRYACRYQPNFLALYVHELRRDGLILPFDVGRTAFDCYRGDVLAGGRGEVLAPCLL